MRHTSSIAIALIFLASTGIADAAITRTLSFGARGNDVVELQTFLIDQELLAADLATGYFGTITEAAVQKFQTSNNIVSSGSAATTGWGMVGPKTRALLASRKPRSGAAIVESTLAPSVPVLPAVLPSSTKKDFRITDYGAILTDTEPDDTAMEQCLTAAIKAGGTCHLPAGTVTLTTYPASIRNPILANAAVLSLNHASLRGAGAASIIRGVSANGFDVLQLNSVSNFTISDLSITAVKTTASETQGVNAISMTNGTHHITIERVSVDTLPHVKKALYTDGGKAFTIQTGKNTQASNAITIRGSRSRNVSVGFELDHDPANSPEPYNIRIEKNDLQGFHAGIVFSFVASSKPLSLFGAAITDNTIAGGRYAVILGRGRGYYFKNNTITLDDKLDTIKHSTFPKRGTFFAREVGTSTIESNRATVGKPDSFVEADRATMNAVVWRNNTFKGTPAQSLLLSNPPGDYPSFTSKNVFTTN